jgi:type IV pilus assembly protein PilA
MRQFFQGLAVRLARDERGFTLIELMITMSIMGTLMAIAMPSYAGFKDVANRTAAAATLNSVVPDIEQYSSDNYAGVPTAQDPDWNGTDASNAGTNADSGYTGLTIAILKSKYDSSLTTSDYSWNNGYTPTSTSTDYCIYTSSGQWYAAKKGPSGTVTTGKTMTLSTCTAA